MPERALGPLAVLERRLRMLAGSIDAEWGIYVRFLDHGDEIGIDADRMIDTMSLIKVPILVALMRRVDRGEVDLGRRITLEEDHKRLGTGVLRLFDAGASFTLHDAARMMIVVSDNTATDLCLEAAGGVDGVNACLGELEIEGLRVTGTALDWFRALASSMDPDLGPPRAHHEKMNAVTDQAALSECARRRAASASMTLLFGSMICAEWRSDVIFIDENDEGPGVRLWKKRGQ